MEICETHDNRRLTIDNSLIAKLVGIFDFSRLSKNEASFARDMLANDRNHLAWIRFALTLVMLGATFLTKFNLGKLSFSSSSESTLEPIGKASFATGVVLAVLGFGSFLTGCYKYFQNQRLLLKHCTLVVAGWESWLMFGVVCLFCVSIVSVGSVLGKF